MYEAFGGIVIGWEVCVCGDDVGDLIQLLGVELESRTATGEKVLRDLIVSAS